MDEALAERLAGACAPQLAKKGLPAIAAVEGARLAGEGGSVECACPTFGEEAPLGSGGRV